MEHFFGAPSIFKTDGEISVYVVSPECVVSVFNEAFIKLVVKKERTEFGGLPLKKTRKPRKPRNTIRKKR
jgi:hypothetical protein